MAGERGIVLSGEAEAADRHRKNIAVWVLLLDESDLTWNAGRKRAVQAAVKSGRGRTVP